MKNNATHWNRSLCLLRTRISALAATAAMGSILFAATQATAQSQPAARIHAEISSSQTTVLPNSKHPLAQAKYDAGRVSADTKLEGISIHFSRTATQEAQLQALLAAQQNPASPQFHQWLAPEQFAAQFGVADSDIAKVSSWLTGQGFTIDSVSRSKNMIRFSGTVAQAEQAFSTEIHSYNIPTPTGTEKHFAPSTDLSIPAGLSGVVQSVDNLSNFRPKSHATRSRSPHLKPSFTSSETGDVFFSPGDIKTVYDVQPLYNGGYTGSGQSITVIGQSEIALSDIEAFQSASGLAVKDPELILVPDTGAATVSTGDEAESDIDLEWSGAIATGATITLVYVGNDTNYDAFDSLQYAIDNKLGTIISSSYGLCEAELPSSEESTLESALEQATSQGQTVMSAAGDDGSTDCYNGSTNPPDPSLSIQQQLAVDFPASSPYVTGVGGTEISTANSAYVTSGSAYWASASTSDVISSALQYIPEMAWNEDTANCGQTDCLSSGGGGTSTLFTKPSWQTGVTGLSSSITMREVPDVALNAATGLPGYLICTSDSTFWSNGQDASCNSGFRDSSTGDLTVGGGTSFAAPIFSGMVALINQSKGYTTGQGLVNPMLYSLAASSTNYASAFHDITSGNNDCLAGSGVCSSTAGFSAGTGYDQVTGLGSVDLGNLANVWSASTGTTLLATTTTVSASNTAPAVNATDTFTITVASVDSSTTPTGTVTITVDSGTPITGSALTANGTVTYTTSFSTGGSHQVLASYSGDATHAASSGSVTVNVPTTSSGTGSIALAATNLSVSQGSSGASTITITPAGGYTGTVYLTFDTSNDSALQNLCYEFTDTLSNGDGSVSVSSATTPVTTQLTLDTNATDCVTTEAIGSPGKHVLRRLSSHHNLSSNNRNNPGKTAPLTLAFAGLLFAGFLGRSSRKLRSIAGVIALVAIGLGISACGGNSSNTISNPPKGTYTVTVTGQDSVSATITGSTTFTFTID
ncbi:protease pro-enzyme activation domain-containing protein [Acidicapsa dinghuensis]|uniref:Protease pro-enzyme activation domain-containing protein n=1 Tax=Acidicapsa dinghuensis TaxID=2218256 RepID=A0ABW1EG66_9BACT|nr:protease pro-enzyme activation domain-containing protein [Acidicapsa dinghuensis]